MAVPADIKAACKSVMQEWQSIDVLVNNAAMMTFKPITEITIEYWPELVG